MRDHKECSIHKIVFPPAKSVWNQIRLFETNLDDIKGKSGDKTEKRKRERERGENRHTLCGLVSIGTDSTLLPFNTEKKTIYRLQREQIELASSMGPTINVNIKLKPKIQLLKTFAIKAESSGLAIVVPFFFFLSIMTFGICWLSCRPTNSRERNKDIKILQTNSQEKQHFHNIPDQLLLSVLIFSYNRLILQWLVFLFRFHDISLFLLYI